MVDTFPVRGQCSGVFGVGVIEVSIKLVDDIEVDNGFEFSSKEMMISRILVRREKWRK